MLIVTKITTYDGNDVSSICLKENKSGVLVPATVKFKQKPYVCITEDTRYWKYAPTIEIKNPETGFTISGSVHNFLDKDIIGILGMGAEIYVCTVYEETLFLFDYLDNVLMSYRDIDNRTNLQASISPLSNLYAEGEFMTGNMNSTVYITDIIFSVFMRLNNDLIFENIRKNNSFTIQGIQGNHLHYEVYVKEGFFKQITKAKVLYGNEPKFAKLKTEGG